MHIGQYVFAQIVSFLPKRYFERLVVKFNDRTKNWTPSHWSHLLVLMFGQLMGCHGLRELTDITIAHAKKSFHLGFGKTAINKSTLSKANNLRDYRIFEEFAFHMVSLAQKRRITREFELHGRFYAVDSTTIDLCMSLFEWAKFRSTKSGIKIHTQVDIITEIPVFYRITNANVHDVNAMDWLTYEPLACYVFDRGYFDFARLYKIAVSGAFFIIVRKNGQVTKSSMVKTLLTERTMFCSIRPLSSRRSRTRRNIRVKSGVLFTTHLNFTVRSLTTRTTSILLPKTSPFFINTGGRSNCSSNGLSNISESSPFGERVTMQYVFKFMSPSLQTVSLESLNTTSGLEDQSCRSCESWEALCLPRMTSWNSSPRLTMKKKAMVSNLNLTSILINIY